MLAHHYREALSLAEAAGLGTTSLREPARQAFAEGARRALSLGAGPVSLELVSEALALTEANDPGRPVLQLLGTYAARMASSPELAGLAEAAVDGFLAHGDTGGAAEAAVLLGSDLFYRGDVENARAMRERSLELARQAPPSPSTARALATVARSAQVLDRENARALELAREALAMAEEAGDDEIAAMCLNTIGLTRVNSGDPGGIEDLELSLDRAAAAGSLFHLQGALNNLANSLWRVGRLAEGSSRIRESRALCERYGFANALLWNDAERVYDADYRGDLEEVFAEAADFLSRDASAVGFQERAVHATRARALLARGQIDDGLADAESALASLREAGHDAQVAPVVLTVAARTLHAAGRDAEAGELLGEVLEGAPDELIYDLPLHLIELGRAEDYLAVTEGSSGHRWCEAGRTAAAGNLADASAIYGQIGAQFAEAWAALLAAERGNTSRLEAALAYFEEQQATPYAQRCRALLQASA